MTASGSHRSTTVPHPRMGTQRPARSSPPDTTLRPLHTETTRKQTASYSSPSPTAPKNQSSCKQSTEHHASSCSSATKCNRSDLCAFGPLARATAPVPTGSTALGRSRSFPVSPAIFDMPRRRFVPTQPSTKSSTRHHAPARCESSPKPMTHSTGCSGCAKTPNRCTTIQR